MNPHEKPIGNNIISCNGKLICGVKAQLPLFIMVHILGLFLFILWNVFVLPFYLFSLPKGFISIPILLYFVSLTAIYHLIQCFITEPGIIPRNYFNYRKENIQLTNTTQNTTDNSDKLGDSLLPVTNMPRIYTERYCFTCNIVRPAKVSHCNVCDNCVIGFDHHCVFISNCVGVRNKKNFYLFIISAWCYTVILIISSLLHVIFILLDKENGIYDRLISPSHSNYILLITFFSLILVTLLLLLIFRKLNRLVASVPSIVGMLGLFFIFYAVKIEVDPDNNLPYYINSFSIVITYISTPCCIFVSWFLYKQTYLVLLGLSTKEFESIKVFIIGNQQTLTGENNTNPNTYPNESDSENGEYYSNRITRLTCCGKLKNFFTFFSTSKPKSLVLK